MHRGGWDNTQILGATSEATCKYYERGLLRPDVDRDVPPPYLKTLSDPMDDDGNGFLDKHEMSLLFKKVKGEMKLLDPCA